MDRLSHVICDAVQEGRWQPIHVSRDGPSISHLMFADDLLLFGEASENQVDCMMQSLETFCSVSGEKVNKLKSSMFFSKNLKREIRNILHLKAGMPITEDIGNYLGVPLSRNRSQRKRFQYIIDRVKNKLANWKTNCLSLAGRITLAKSVLATIPLYPMQVARVPTSACHEVEKLQRKFIWGNDDTKKKMHYVSWEKLCWAKEHGGLGFRKLDSLNRACGAKLTWKLASGEQGLWIDVLFQKYINGREEIDWKARATDSHLWKFLVQQKPIIELGTGWVVRNGLNVKFFTDCWLKNEVRIADVCLRNLSEQEKNSHVADWTVDGQWDLERMQGIVPTELLQRIITKAPPSQSFGDDRMNWSLNTSGMFSVKSAYHLLENSGSSPFSKIFKKIWKWEGAERIRVFLWLVTHDKLPTNARKNRWSGCSSICDWCNESDEDLIHVVRDCKYAKNMWLLVLKPSVTSVFFNATVQDWIYLNLTHELGKNCLIPWALWWGVAIWKLWTWRNHFIYQSNFVKPFDPSLVISLTLSYYSKSPDRRAAVSSHFVDRVKCKWEPPEESWIKINVDGATAVNSDFAACAGVMRDASGAWVAGFNQFLGRCLPNEAEEWAIFKGLQTAWTLGFKKVIVESDAKLVIDRITGPHTTSEMDNSVMVQIKQFRNRNWQLNFQFIPREVNRVADQLAKESLTLRNDFNFIDGAPDYLVALLFSDYMGYQSPLNSLIN